VVLLPDADAAIGCLAEVLSMTVRGDRVDATVQGVGSATVSERLTDGEVTTARYETAARAPET
jgi:hypothetical protein